MIGPVQEGPVILFGHANGMAAGSYLQLLEELALQATVFTFDARGHGGSSAPETELDLHYNMDAFATDLEVVTESVRNEIGTAPLYYAAHSLNAVAALRLGSMRKRRFWEGCTLFEPPIFPPPAHPLHAEAERRTDELVRLSQNRKARWPNPKTLADALKRKSLFRLFEEGRLLDYARANLRPTGEEDYTLTSPRKSRRRSSPATSIRQTMTACPTSRCRFASSRATPRSACRRLDRETGSRFHRTRSRRHA